MIPSVAIYGIILVVAVGSFYAWWEGRYPDPPSEWSTLDDEHRRIMERHERDSY